MIPINFLIRVFIVLIWTVHSNGSPIVQYMVYPHGESICSSNQFLCSSGLCIHETSICNGISDCPLGDDEQSCPSRYLSVANSSSSDCAPEKFYQCAKSKKCIPWSQICDGKIQCLMADDENHESCASVPGFNVQQPKQLPQSKRSLQQPQGQQNLAPQSGKEPPQQVDQVLGSKLTPKTFSYGQWTTPSTPTSSYGYSTWSYGSSTVDYSNYGNYGNNYTSDNGTKEEYGAASVKTNKAVQSGDQSQNNFYQDQDEPGFVFVNFGPIISGDKNVNGNGNDIGNGNANGNGNGNGNGNTYGKDQPNERNYRNDYNVERSY